MSDETFEQCMSLMEKAMESGQNGGAFNLSVAHIMRLCLHLLRKEPTAVLKNGENHLTRIQAAELLKQGLKMIQEKGGIIGNISSAIKLKQTVELLIQIEKQKADAFSTKEESDKEEITYTEHSLLQDTIISAPTIAEATVPLRAFAENVQFLGYIKTEALETVEIALRRLEESDAKTNDKRKLQEGVLVLVDICEGVQQKGGVFKTLADASKYKNMLVNISSLIESMSEISIMEETPDSDAQMKDEQPNVPFSPKRPRSQI